MRQAGSNNTNTKTNTKTNTNTNTKTNTRKTNRPTQIGQVVAALFATELFHVHFRAKSSGIQDRVKFEISTHFSVLKWKK